MEIFPSGPSRQAMASPESRCCNVLMCLAWSWSHLVTRVAVSLCRSCNFIAVGPRQSPFPHYGMKSLVQFLQCDFEVFKGVPVIIWTGLLWCGVQPMKREVGLKCLENMVWTVLCICVCPGNATLALTQLYKRTIRDSCPICSLHKYGWCVH